MSDAAGESSERARGREVSRASSLVNRLFSICLSLTLLIIALPLMTVIFFMVLATEGRPVFYRGKRLGIHKSLFTMYKFRTLVWNAEKIIGAQLLNHSHNLVTPIGKFLRETRLDELPQLYNILKGDMDFVGPRPERPAIYEKVCSKIKDYDRRFSTRPGMIGYSQLFTPHSAPKRLRTIIDNKMMAKKQLLFGDAYVVLFTAVTVALICCRKLLKILCWDVFLVRIVSRYKEKRDTGRISLKNGKVFLCDEKGNCREEGILLDIGCENFLMRCSRPIQDPLPEYFKLQVELKRCGGRSKRKRAVCVGEMTAPPRQDEGHFDYIVEYNATSPLNHYLVHQYFLRESIA